MWTSQLDDVYLV